MFVHSLTVVELTGKLADTQRDCSTPSIAIGPICVMSAKRPNWLQYNVRCGFIQQIVVKASNAWHALVFWEVELLRRRVHKWCRLTAECAGKLADTDSWGWTWCAGVGMLCQQQQTSSLLSSRCQGLSVSLSVAVLSAIYIPSQSFTCTVVGGGWRKNDSGPVVRVFFSVLWHWCHCIPVASTCM